MIIIIYILYPGNRDYIKYIFYYRVPVCVQAHTTLVVPAKDF